MYTHLKSEKKMIFTNYMRYKKKKKNPLKVNLQISSKLNVKVSTKHP